jgi:hypothetical protein
MCKQPNDLFLTTQDSSCMYLFSDLGMISWFDGEIEVARVGESGGYGDFTDGIHRLVSEISSLFEHEGGQDVIYLGKGDDVGIVSDGR